MLIVATDRSGVAETTLPVVLERQVVNHDIPVLFRYLHEGGKLRRIE